MKVVVINFQRALRNIRTFRLLNEASNLTSVEYSNSDR